VKTTYKAPTIKIPPFILTIVGSALLPLWALDLILLAIMAVGFTYYRSAVTSWRRGNFHLTPEGKLSIGRRR
jgi:hypothetical protein